MDTWPIGTRDTIEFPKISPVKVQYRDHLEKILKLHGKDWNDIGEFGTSSRFRSYRKMYERLGIICKNGDKLASTWLSPISVIFASPKDTIDIVPFLKAPFAIIFVS